MGQINIDQFAKFLITHSTHPFGLTMKESTMVTVSAVIPTRGRPELLRRAVRSALAQTLCDIEVLVVIDGSDPITDGVLQELVQQDPRVRVIALPSSVGGSD